MSTELLVSKQNRDGGWPYVRGISWTEPTVYAILALLAAGETEATNRGLAWIRARQRPDGGWPPQMGFDESTWVTALVALLPRQALGAGAHQGAIAWLTGLAGEETSNVYRVRQWLLGNNVRPEHEFAGWPWIPGAAAWVGPTSLAILALDKEHSRAPSEKIRRRLEDGRHFLLRRMCIDGGWNHGSVRALGYESSPYPETTGMALSALRGVREPQIPMSVTVAQRFLGECRSADACNWLRLGLLAQGQLPTGYCRPAAISCRTLTETSLDLLAVAAQQGRKTLWAS
jgi:squalene cyclase